MITNMADLTKRQLVQKIFKLRPVKAVDVDQPPGEGIADGETVALSDTPKGTGAKYPPCSLLTKSGALWIVTAPARGEGVYHEKTGNAWGFTGGGWAFLIHLGDGFTP